VGQNLMLTFDLCGGVSVAKSILFLGRGSWLVFHVLKSYPTREYCRCTWPTMDGNLISQSCGRKESENPSPNRSFQTGAERWTLGKEGGREGEREGHPYVCLCVGKRSKGIACHAYPNFLQ